MQSPVGSGRSAPPVRLVLDVQPREDEWVLPDEDMPESSAHRDTVRLLELILLAFVARAGRNAMVAANLACRWNPERPSIGVDPDVALIEPAPPHSGELESLRTWLPGHAPPRFAIEVVSASHPAKDYVDAPAKYAVLGTRELVVFDPALQGPTADGGPFILQVWRRERAGREMTRVYAGAGPARSEELNAWLIHTGERILRIADDAEGRSLWLTGEERALLGAIEDVCELCGIPIDDARRAHLAKLDVRGLEALRARIKQERAWPA